MKITFLDLQSNPYKPGDGGTSDTIWNMARSALQLGHQAKIMAPYLSQEYPFPEVPVVAFSIPSLARRNIIGAIVSHIYLAKAIKRFCDRDELLHTRDYLAAVTLSLLTRQKIVITVAGNPFERRKKRIPAFDPITTLVYLTACKISARIKKCYFIATSQELRKWWLISGVDEKRITLIPLGIDVDLFTYQDGSREKMGWKDDDWHLLYVGRLIPKLKGLEELVEAVSILNKTTNIHLHLVGNGAAEASIKKEVDRLGISSNVSFYGWVDQKELPLFYSAADLSILPSFSEGFGRTMLESMSCGTPILGTRVGGMADHIQDEVTGFHLDEISSQAISEKIEKIFDASELLMVVAKQCQQYVREKLSWDLVMTKVIGEVYLPLQSKWKAQ